MLGAVPIRWRLALLITIVTTAVLAVFAGVVMTVTSARLRDDFEQNVTRSAEDLASRIEPVVSREDGDLRIDYSSFNVRAYARGGSGVVRVAQRRGTPFDDTRPSARLGPRAVGARQVGQLYVVTRRLTSPDGSVSDEPILVQYGRSTTELEATTAQIRLLLLVGVGAGSALALLAGLFVAGRALTPITQLTATANQIARTGDGSRRLPVPARADELSDLARTLDAMLDSLDAARSTTERTLTQQREFLADASHELRTPLTSLITNLEMIVDSDDAEAAEAAEAALRSARRMRGLVTDLLALARADVSDGRRHVAVSLVEPARDAIEETADLLGDHEVDVDLHDVMVVGDRDDLQRLVRNLLENAARHTPPGTRIRVRAGLRGGQASLSVEDDGPGVAPSIRARVFERFVRAPGAAGPSSGLGLSIVRATAQAHGGWVDLRSPIRAGRGTRIDVRLPLAEGASPAQTSTTTGSTIGRRRSLS